ncbi:MAG: acetoacetate--CoA ligase [Neisseriaceae bacterium]
MLNIKWKPTKEQIASSQINKFIKFINQTLNLELTDSDDLYNWSVNDIEAFWSAFWQFSNIKASKLWKDVLINENDMLNAKWFTESKLNYAENLLKRKDSELAIVFRGENKIEWKYTFKELYDIVAKLADSLRRLGVAKGDRIAGFMPNLPQTVMAMLATASIGAVWTSCSPDFGINGVLDRLGQIEPKILFTVDGYFYNTKQLDCCDKVIEIIKQIPSIKKVIITNYINSNNIEQVPNSYTLNDCLKQSNANTINFEQVSFDDPLFIMYSSGTTGKPKCIVHSVGGTLIQHLKEHMLHTNLKANDRIFYYTTCGWMMWNWLVSSLATGATLMLYDGSPIPNNNEGILFKYIDDYQINIFGTSAKYLSALEKTGYKPIIKNKLNSLTTILSTGSPLLPENYNFVYQNIKKDVLLCSISGGTDIISCFALGNPTKPVHNGELQQIGFAMAVKILNEDGTEARIDEKGELSCIKPFPSQPIYFWNDPEKEKYKQAYFNKVSNVWCHGDFAAKTKYNGIIIYGRSDTTLNPGGIRIGTAEIYRQIETINEIAESVVIGQKVNGDERVVLFVKMQPHKNLTEDIINDIKHKIRFGASPHHVPAIIVAVIDIPKTVSGKIAELAVKNIIDGEVVKNQNALINPESLKLFENLKELSI